MVEYTDGTRKFLEARYSKTGDGKYCGHQPIYGHGGFSEPGHIRKLALTVQILRTLDGLEFQSCLDVGGGEGYMSNLVRTLFDTHALNSELSFEASSRATELYGMPAICNDASLLPFADNSFDLVICSEVLEHTVDPVLVISELDRVAKKYLLITTERFCKTEQERYTSMKTVPIWIPHADRNYFTLADFVDLLGKNLEFSRQYVADVWKYDDSEHELNKIKDMINDVIEAAAKGEDEGEGLILLKTYAAENAAARKPAGYTISELIEFVLTNKIDESAKEAKAAKWDDSLIKKLRCVECESQLENKQDTLICGKCGSESEIRNEIPILLTSSKTLVEKKHRRLSGFYERYDTIFPRNSSLDPRERFHISKIGDEWETHRDASDIEFYVAKRWESSLVTESRPGANCIRFICRTENAAVPLTIMADGIIPLTTVHATPTWQTYIALFPFARKNVEVSFRIGKSQGHFSELIQDGGEDEPQLFLFSFETVNLISSTEIRLTAAEERLKSAEEKITHLNMLLPIRLYRKLRRLD